MPNGIDIVAIRTAIRAQMMKVGITSAKLAEQTGISKATIDNFLDGTTTSPAFDRVCAMLKILNLSIDELIGIRPPAPQTPIVVPADTDALQAAHVQTLEAKDAHIQELKEQNMRLHAHNMRLTKWHRIFVAENIAIALLFVVDFFVPTFGYFRDAIAKKLSGSSRPWG